MSSFIFFKVFISWVEKNLANLVASPALVNERVSLVHDNYRAMWNPNNHTIFLKFI